MELYLMQHGQAVAGSDDPDPPLSADGTEQIKAAAKAMRRLGILPATILCSPKQRARQTAALVAQGLQLPAREIVATETVKPTAPASDALAYLGRYPESRAILIAGHLPSLAEIAALILGGTAPFALQFENGGLCRIDAETPAAGRGRLIFHIPAAPMRMLAGG